VTDLTLALWDEVLAPEEVELVDEYLADHYDQARATQVYALLLADGAVYVGISYDATHRLKGHARNALKTHADQNVAVEVTDTPSEVFLAIHGEPQLVALVVCPTRRHAHLYEALLTARIAEAGVHVHGAGFDKTLDAWARNEVRGVKLDDHEALAALVAR
jgi:hypothetical protein